MIFNIIMSCSYQNFIWWLQNHLLTCPFKKLTGFDCPGCGFQRSVLSLLQGDVYKSLQLYPATIPIFTIAFLAVFENKLPLDKINIIKKSLYLFTGIIIAGAYLVKIRTYL